MSTRRYRRVLLVVLLALVPALVGVLATSSATSQAAGLRDPQAVEYDGAQAFSITPGPEYLLAAPGDTFIITPTAGPHGAIDPDTPQTVDYGANLTFTFTPETGYHVADVRVDNKSQGPSESYTFTSVTANHTIRVSFAPDTFTITPTSGPHGSISPSTPQAVDYGGSQTFTILPDPGYHVADVLVDDVPQGAVTSYTFTNVTAEHTISATFAIDTFTITPSAGLHGSISPSTPQTVDYGGTQAFTIAADPGYLVVDVLVDGASVGAVTSYTFTNVSADHTIAAAFARDTYTITPSAGLHGAISPAAPQTVAYGATQVFTITPATGYHVANVLVDGVSAGAVTSYTFSNVTADHTISATFAIDVFTITPSAGLHGSISPSTPQIVIYSADRAFTITPATGYHVADVLVDGVSVGAVTGYTFINVTADHTISATFVADAFTITPSAGLHGSISPASQQTVEYGGSQAFSITAAAGYYVADVLVDGESVGGRTSYSFENVDADHTISATFAPGVQTELWISTVKTVVTYGGGTLLQGELSDASDPVNHVGLGGRLVAVEYAASADGPWKTLGEYRTSAVDGSLGQFELTVSPTSPTYYQLKYETEPLSGYGGVVSRVVRVGVRPLVSRPTVPTSVRAGRWFTAKGSLRPHFAAGEKTVKIKVYRYRNGRWVYVKALSATNVDSGSFTEYRLKTRFATRGKYRFRATTTAGVWAAATTSLSRTLVVR